MDKSVHMLDENHTPLDSRRPGSVFVCSARIGLGRPRADFCGLPMIRDERRGVDPPLEIEDKDWSRKREETWTEIWRAETNRDQIRSPKEIFSDERRDHERRLSQEREEGPIVTEALGRGQLAHALRTPYRRAMQWRNVHPRKGAHSLTDASA
ncbi:hypothetical protein TNCV_1919201 [Trichonephila clavipes]|nr:hypothetical protein TNCV_1919201 [Trichonephila clavipes]